MRLIDADALLKQPLDKANYPSNYVREAPTVCDIEQIRAEVEQCKGNFNTTSSDTCFDIVLQIIDKHITE